MNKTTTKAELLQIKLSLETAIQDIKKKIESIDMVLSMINDNKYIPDTMEPLTSGVLSQVINNDSYPEYPVDGDILEKIRYYEELTNRVFALRDFKEFVEKAEGKRKADKTLNFINQKINFMIRKGNIICMKYNGSNKYSFYTSRKEWLDIKGKNKVRVIFGHEPNADKLQKLSEEQKSEESIKWSGIHS